MTTCQMCVFMYVYRFKEKYAECKCTLCTVCISRNLSSFKHSTCFTVFSLYYSINLHSLTIAYGWKHGHYYVD